MFKKLLIVLIVLFIGIQFYHAKPNKSTVDEAYYIGKKYPVPEDVKSILAKACNDCHSNNTRYPWYAKVQPVDWWTNRHVQEGKRELNFDGFTDHSPRFQYIKMDEMIEQVKEGKMPLNSYTWIHKDAVLTQQEKEALTGWAQSVRDSLEANYPKDSLVRKKRP